MEQIVLKRLFVAAVVVCVWGLTVVTLGALFGIRLIVIAGAWMFVCGGLTMIVVAAVGWVVGWRNVKSNPR